MGSSHLAVLLRVGLGADGVGPVARGSGLLIGFLVSPSHGVCSWQACLWAASLPFWPGVAGFAPSKINARLPEFTAGLQPRESGWKFTAAHRHLRAAAASYEELTEPQRDFLKPQFSFMHDANLQEFMASTC